MEITWRNYRITMNPYSWDLHKGVVYTQKEYDKVVAKGQTPKHQVGHISWYDEGFFTNLDTLLNKIIRLEGEKSKSVLEINDFMEMWKGILSDMGNEIKVKAEEVVI